MSRVSESDERPYHHGDLARELVATAADLLESEGVGRLSLRSVARAASVSHAAPYRHFRDKQELLEAVAAEGFLELGDRFEGVRQGTFETPRERIVAACRAYVEQVLERPERSHLMFGGLLGPKRRSATLDEAAERSFGRLVALVRRGQEEGLFRADLSVLDLAMTLWPATHGIALLAAADQLSAVDPTRSPGEMAERLVVLLLDGVGRAPLETDSSSL